MGQSSSASNSAYGSTGNSDVIRACRCYSRGPSCVRHSSAFNSSSSSDPLRKHSRRSHHGGFATFKKKLIGRCCKGSGGHLREDSGKLFREYALEAPTGTLQALLDTYQVSLVLKDLATQADLSRPPAQDLRSSLKDLLDSQSCPDITLASPTSPSEGIPAHTSILYARCPTVYKQIPSMDASLSSSPSTAIIDLSTEALRGLLEVLYTGESSSSMQPCQVPSHLVPNSLESDVAYLYESMSLWDCELVFGASETLEGFSSCSLRCHRAVLAGRSTFFRKLIHRKLNGAHGFTTTCHDSLRLLLDENVIPARYGKVLIEAMYLDTLDLSLVSPCEEELEGSVGCSEDPRVLYAMDLYEIGRFLEFELLSQSCEDYLAQSLRPGNVNIILDWSLKPHGSAWIRRQAFQYVQEEFSLISHSECFERLDINILKDLLESDYTQASELEILQAIIRWGELQLLHKSDSKGVGESLSCGARRSNPIHPSSGGNSSGSSGSGGLQLRRREICDNELRSLVSPLLSCLRIQHILPKDDRHSDFLDNALHRNLIPRPPCFFAQTDDYTKYSAWDPRNPDGLYVKPRLFLPYYEECKNILKDRLGQEYASSDLSFPCFDIPDTLYMVKNQNDASEILEQQPNSLPDKERIAKMVKRTGKLLQTVAVQRAMASPLVHKWDVVHLVELRVVRECNLPDSYTSVLRSSDIDESNYRESTECSAIDKFDILQTRSLEGPSMGPPGPSSSGAGGPDVLNLTTGHLSNLSLGPEISSSSSIMTTSPDIVDGMMMAAAAAVGTEAPVSSSSGGISGFLRNKNSKASTTPGGNKKYLYL